MTLPISGNITASMINTELYRAANAAFTLNDTTVRRLAGIVTPNTSISFTDFYGKTNEVVATLANSNSIVLKSYFTTDDWNNPNINKRVVIPTGVQIGATNLTYAIAPTYSADGQAGSWKGILTLENRGTISGMGGQPNGGTGGSCIWMNFPGADNQKMNIINTGTIRPGGGAGGVGGQGGPGYYYDYQNSGWQLGSYYRIWEQRWNGSYYNTISIWWDGVAVYNVFADWGTGGPSSINTGTWTYLRGAYAGKGFGGGPEWDYYYVARQLTTPNVIYTSGGPGGTAGRGQGFDGSALTGSGGAGGGINAGTGGTGGTGAAYGITGGTGGTGGAGNNGGGYGGGAGGPAGYYIINNAYTNITNSGTILGRLG